MLLQAGGTRPAMGTVQGCRGSGVRGWQRGWERYHSVAFEPPEPPEAPEPSWDAVPADVTAAAIPPPGLFCDK